MSACATLRAVAASTSGRRPADATGRLRQPIRQTLRRRSASAPVAFADDSHLTHYSKAGKRGRPGPGGSGARTDAHHQAVSAILAGLEAGQVPGAPPGLPELRSHPLEQRAPRARTAASSSSESSEDSSSASSEDEALVVDARQPGALAARRAQRAAGRLAVCQGTDCGRRDSAAVLAEAAASAAGSAVEVVPCKCLGLCGRGPNAKATGRGRKPVRYTGVESAAVASQVLRAEFGLEAAQAELHEFAMP